MRSAAWYAGAALAVALDAGRPEALAFLSLCGSGSLLSAAAYAVDPNHFRAIPWTSAWMLIGCLWPLANHLPHDAPGARRRWLRQALCHAVALAAAMALACALGWLVARALPPIWPGALSVAVWAGAMLLGCAGLMHLFVRCGPARLRASRPSDSSSSLSNRSIPC